MRPALKRALFWSVTVLLPFAALACVELLFRATGLFAPEPLFFEVPGSHATALKFNSWVSRRYFDSTAAALPNLAPESFSRTKTASTFRILCLGESTTAGFPFESQVPFPAQLREILAHAFPRKRIEVLNAGMSAISSYVVLDLLPELLRESKPDLVIMYLGHNEFYGVYGSGSTLFPGKRRTMVLAMLRLQHLHVVQMLKRLVQAVRPHASSHAESRTLMQNVVGDQDIALGSPEYRTTMESFRANLEEMADCCRDHGVPFLISNLVSNYRDQPPFHSLEVRAGEPAKEVEFALGTGDSLLAVGQPRAAELSFHRAWQTDSSNADAWFGIGRARLAQGDSSAALRWFLGAKDRDAMRFRAPEDANGIIAGIAGTKRGGFVDMVQAFRSASPGGVIGKELMCDHLHPNARGYYLMAAAFYRGVIDSGILPAPDSTFRVPGEPYGVTDLDWEIGLLKVFPMTREWPFKQTPIRRGDYHPYGDTAATRVAALYHRTGFAWVRAHDMMAHIYVERKDFDRARREYDAVAVYQPDDPWPYQQIAALYGEEGNWKLRSASLQEALVRSPVKGMIAYQLALSESKLGHIENAIRGMDFASGAPELTREERQNARFYLAGFLFDSGRRELSVKTLRSMLEDDPSFAPAREFLSRLERSSR